MSRTITTFILLLAAAVTAPAADETAAPPPTAAPAPEDAIATAKREFEVIKASRDPVLQQKDGTVRLNLPDLQAGAPFPNPRGMPNPDAKKKSANWLVDAMERKPTEDRSKDRHGSDRTDSSRERTDPLTGLPRDSASETDAPAQTQSEAAAADAKERDNKPTTVNPLTRFMGDWMTAQDYSLLRPVLDAAQAQNGDARNASSPALGLNGITSIAGVGGDSAGAFSMDKPVAPAPALKENPYLEALNSAGAPPSVTFTPPAQPVAAPAPNPELFRPLPPPPTSKSVIPDFVKPTTDEKYFKQLKRF